MKPGTGLDILEKDKSVASAGNRKDDSWAVQLVVDYVVQAPGCWLYATVCSVFRIFAYILDLEMNQMSSVQSKELIQDGKIVTVFPLLV